jgi:hypothetical protein
LALITLLSAMAVVSGGCIAATGPTMAGVNHTNADAYVRLVVRGGGFQDFLLPRTSLRLLDAHLNVDRVVLFDDTCREVGTVVFGDGNVPFSEGGQIYLGPRNEAGMTTELAPVPGPAAEPADACANVPTPVDPRIRTPLDGGSG